MSSLASTSDLSRQPDFDSTSTAVSKKKKRGKKAVNAASASKAPQAHQTPKATSLGYGYNALAGDTRLSMYIESSRSKGLQVFRTQSPVLRNLPFKSALLFSADDLPNALRREMEALGTEVVPNYEKLEVRFHFLTDATSWPVITPT